MLKNEKDFQQKINGLPQAPKMPPRLRNDMLFEKAFTLAEVLITLVIIGVVAAITVPILFNNANDKEYVVACQKVKATIGEAFRLMTVNGEITSSLSTKEFVEQVIPKYLKVANTCETAATCGFPEIVKRPDGVKVNTLTDWSLATNMFEVMNPPTAVWQWSQERSSDNRTSQNYKTSYFFQTLDGISVNFFYNPYCVSTKKEKASFYNSVGIAQQSLDVNCFNAVYDMNGLKGPNQVGKDIGFVGSFYNSYETVAVSVLPHKEIGTSRSLDEALKFCKDLDSDGNYVLPDVNELSLLFLNRYLQTPYILHWFWTRSLQEDDSSRAKSVGFSDGARYWFLRTENSNVYIRCIRNNALK